MVWWLGLMALVDTASAESCLVQGMAYQSSRVGTLPNGAWVSDASTCQSNCAASPFCDYFTWYNDSKSCWLFGDQATLKAHGNATSGPKICDPVDTKMSVTTGSEEDEKKVVAKLGKLAQVIKTKTNDPKVIEDADKVIRSTSAGILPDRDIVYPVVNEVSAVLTLEEAEKEHIVVVEEDLKVINNKELGGLEPAKPGVSYGAGAPWRDAVVPYCFLPSISHASIQNTQAAESPAIFVTDREQGCFADIGMQFQVFGGSQVMNVPPICSVGVVLHELNIKPGMEGQFGVMGNADASRPYDLTSIMHYGPTAFTKNGLPTLALTARGQQQLNALGAYTIGQRDTLSQLDFEQLVHLYHCTADVRGMYSTCNPPPPTDWLAILVGVFAAIAILGCGAFCLYFYCKKQRQLQRKAAGPESRPLMEALQEALRAAQAALLALRPKEVFRLDSQRLRAMNGLLCAGQGLLHVSHLSLHPNSLTLEGQRALEQRALRGCLMKIALDRLLSVQFHMPRLPDVLALLEALARSPCRCLRKIVDRQSRWRPRELQFEQMEEKGGTESSDSGSVAELLNELPHLQHLEGPVFSVLLRARRHASEATPTSGGQTPLSQVICKFLPQAPELKELQLDFQYFDPALWDLESLEALVARVQAAPSKITKLVLDPWLWQGSETDATLLPA
eukprot:g9526.t1